MAGGEEAYWTCAEASTWICTRDKDAVHAVTPGWGAALEEQKRDGLRKLIEACRSDRIRAVGRRSIWPPWYLKYSFNYVDQTRWLNAGHPSEHFESIPAHEWVDLEWAIMGGELILKSKRNRRIEWVMVQFSRPDLIRKWPGGRAAKRNRGRKPKKRDAVIKKMRDDVKMHRADLEQMTEDQLVDRYGCSRSVVRAARDIVLEPPVQN
jgi:hypothetical protein